jgi:hypothetical protein
LINLPKTGQASLLLTGTIITKSLTWKATPLCSPLTLEAGKQPNTSLLTTQSSKMFT